jgi:hypothetical protein
VHGFPTPWGKTCHCIRRLLRGRRKIGPGRGCNVWLSTLSMYVLSGYSCSTYSDWPSSSVSLNRSSSITIVNLFDETSLRSCCMRDHCFHLAGWQAILGHKILDVSSIQTACVNISFLVFPFTLILPYFGKGPVNNGQTRVRRTDSLTAQIIRRMDRLSYAPRTTGSWRSTCMSTNFFLNGVAGLYWS